MTDWDGVAGQERASWYLDALAGRQKRELHLKLIREWMPHGAGLALKTDLFEEAFGKDDLLPALSLAPQTWIAMDISAQMVKRAAANGGVARTLYLAADTCSLPLRSGCLDVVLSTSTLDHFSSRVDFERAVGELVRVLRPGGRLLITVNNPSNPLYPLLRWICRRGPFPLGYTPSAATLNQILASAGLQVTATQVLIHNPRMVSSGIFLVLRYLLNSHADRPIQWLLDAFARLDHLPTRRYTACFLAASAVAAPPLGN